MPKVDRNTLRQIEAAFERFKVQLKQSDLEPGVITTYIYDVGRFIRWLDDRYEPGGKLLRPRVAGTSRWKAPPEGMDVHLSTFVEEYEGAFPYLSEIRERSRELGVPEWYDKIIDWLRRLDANEDMGPRGWYLTDRQFTDSLCSPVFQGYITEDTDEESHAPLLELGDLISQFIEHFFEEA